MPTFQSEESNFEDEDEDPKDQVLSTAETQPDSGPLKGPTIVG